MSEFKHKTKGSIFQEGRVSKLILPHTLAPTDWQSQKLYKIRIRNMN
jgi:hypothetical protein